MRNRNINANQDIFSMSKLMRDMMVEISNRSKMLYKRDEINFDGTELEEVSNYKATVMKIDENQLVSEDQLYRSSLLQLLQAVHKKYSSHQINRVDLVDANETSDLEMPVSPNFDLDDERQPEVFTPKKNVVRGEMTDLEYKFYFGDEAECDPREKSIYRKIESPHLDKCGLFAKSLILEHNAEKAGILFLDSQSNKEEELAQESFNNTFNPF